MRYGEQDPHTRVGAYALNALDAREREEFEEHLSGCDTCAQEVRGLSEAAAVLGASAAEPAPRALRRRVLSEISRTRQLPPPTAARARRRPWRRRMPTVLLAACLVAVLALGGVVFYAQSQMREMRAMEQEMGAVLAAPDSQSMTEEPEAGVSVSVVYSAERGQLVFSAYGLEEYSDADYQLWVKGSDGRARSGGVVEVDEDGMVMPMVTPCPRDTVDVAVTMEPVGGSPAPSGEPMIEVALPE